MPTKKITTKKKVAANNVNTVPVASTSVKKSNDNFNKYAAELIGTFFLALAVILSAESPLATPFAAALTLGLFVYTIGSISGCHINPAVTLSLLSIKKIEPEAAISYIVAQIIGGLLAFILASLVIGTEISFSVFEPEYMTALAGIGEMIGTFIFVFGIAAVVQGGAKESVSGIVIGGSLLLGIVIAGSYFSAGILNPAVAVGLGILSPVYIIGQIAGGILGAMTYSWLADK